MTHAQRVLSNVIYQTDPRFPWYVNRYGCRWRALAAIAEMVTGKALSYQQLADLLEENRKDPEVLSFLDDKHMLCGPDEHEIINWAFALLGSFHYSRQVGMEATDNTVTMWGPSDQWEYQLIHWETAGADGHYTLGDREGVELFDPWNNDDLTPVYLNQLGLSPDYRMHKRSVRRRLLYRIWRLT